MKYVRYIPPPREDGLHEGPGRLLLGGVLKAILPRANPDLNGYYDRTANPHERQIRRGAVYPTPTSWFTEEPLSASGSRNPGFAAGGLLVSACA
jgi:hypothetical protein